MGEVEEGPKEGLASAFLAQRLFICFRRASIPRLGISIHLPDRVAQGDQIAARRFGSATGRVPRKFYLIEPFQ